MDDINHHTSSLTKALIVQNRVQIGAELRQIRETLNMSQEQLGEKMNINRSTISKIESGKFNCSLDYLSKFAFFLEFNIVLSKKVSAK